MLETVITLTIRHKKPIEDILDKVAGRVYTLAGGDGDVTAQIVLTQDQLNGIINAAKETK